MVIEIRNQHFHKDNSYDVQLSTFFANIAQLKSIRC